MCLVIRRLAAPSPALVPSAAAALGRAHDCCVAPCRQPPPPGLVWPVLCGHVAGLAPVISDHGPTPPSRRSSDVHTGGVVVFARAVAAVFTTPRGAATLGLAEARSVRANRPASRLHSRSGTQSGAPRAPRPRRCCRSRRRPPRPRPTSKVWIIPFVELLGQTNRPRPTSCTLRRSRPGCNRLLRTDQPGATRPRRCCRSRRRSPRLRPTSKVLIFHFSFARF